MPFFGKSSRYAEVVQKATSPANTNENWQKIMEICDMINQEGAPDDAVTQLRLKLTDKNPNVQRQAIKVIQACCNNCGKSFHVALCCRGFVGEVKGLLLPRSQTHPMVVKELKEMIHEIEIAFGNDPQLSLIRITVNELKAQGVEFFAPETSTPSAKSAAVEAAEREEEELNLAIAASLSLAETQGSSQSTQSSVPMPKQHGDLLASRPAKCLYDFEATEDNELSFAAGDVIVVTDSSDANWWSGHNQSGELGYFPASFVTYDLNSQIEKEIREPTPPPVVIDEEKLDQCLDLLYDAMSETTPEKLATIEKLMSECEAMGPLIEKQISVFDEAGAKLTDMNSRFESAVQLFQQMKTAKPLPAAAAAPAPSAAPSMHAPGRAPPPQAFFGQHPSAYSQQQPSPQQNFSAASSMYHPPMPSAHRPNQYQQGAPMAAAGNNNPPIQMSRPQAAYGGMQPNHPPPQNQIPAKQGGAIPGNPVMQQGFPQPTQHQQFPPQQQQQMHMQHQPQQQQFMGGAPYRA